MEKVGEWRFYEAKGVRGGQERVFFTRRRVGAGKASSQVEGGCRWELYEAWGGEDGRGWCW